MVRTVLRSLWLPILVVVMSLVRFGPAKLDEIKSLISKETIASENSGTRGRSSWALPGTEIP